MGIKNSYVFSATWGERVRRYVAFYGQGIDTWESGLIKPSCPVVAVRGVGPNEKDVVYVGSTDGWLYQLDFNDGSSLSQFPIWNPHVTDAVRGVAYSEGVLYVNAGKALYSVSLSAGPLWKQPMGNLAWGAPVVSNGIIYAGSWDNKLYANNADGSSAWVSQAANFFAAEPVVSNGTVYASAFEGLFALDAANGAVLWQAQTDDNFKPGRPSLGDSAVYVTTAGTSVYRFDSTGQKIWKKTLPTHSGDPTYENGRVFVGTGNGGTGFVYALDADNHGNQLWVSAVPVTGLGDAISAVAVDRGGTPHMVFVASQDQHLYAFARSDGWLAWKAKIADGSPSPIDPVWSDDPLEMPFNMAAAPSGWLVRTQIRHPVPRPAPKKKAKKRHRN